MAWTPAFPTRHTSIVNKTASCVSPLLHFSVSSLLWKDNSKELEYKSFLMFIQSLVYLLSRVPISVSCNGGFCTMNILQLGIGLKDHHLISHWKPKQSSHSNNFWSLLTQTSSNQWPWNEKVCIPLLFLPFLKQNGNAKGSSDWKESKCNGYVIEPWALNWKPYSLSLF